MWDGSSAGFVPKGATLGAGFSWGTDGKTQPGAPFVPFSGLGWHLMLSPRDIPAWHRITVGDLCHGAGGATPNPHSPWGALVHMDHWNPQTQRVQGKVGAVQAPARQERLHLVPKSSMVPATFCHSLNLSPCPVAMGFPVLFLAPVSLAPCWGAAVLGTWCWLFPWFHYLWVFLHTHCGALWSSYPHFPSSCPAAKTYFADPNHGGSCSPCSSHNTCALPPGDVSRPTAYGKGCAWVRSQLVPPGASPPHHGQRFLCWQEWC